MADPTTTSPPSTNDSASAPEPEEREPEYHPLVEPYRKMRSSMWPPGTSQYVLENSTPEWEARLIAKMTQMYEGYLHHLDDLVRQKEEEYLATMKSDRSILYKIMETHAYRSMTGGAVGYYYPQPNEPNLDGPQRVREFGYRLLSIQRQRPKPKHFAVREFQSLKSLPLDQQRTVGVAVAIVDEYCYRVSGTDDKVMMVTSLQMEAFGTSTSARVAAMVKPPAGIKIPITVPKVTKANPQVRGAARTPGAQAQRGGSQRKVPNRKPHGDDITEPTPAPVPESFPIQKDASPARAMRDLFLPARARGSEVLDRLVRARFTSPKRMVDETLAALRMLGRQAGLDIKIKTPINAQGVNNVSFRSEPGSIVVDKRLLSQPSRLREEVLHDAAAIYLFRQYNGVWPNAKNTNLLRNSMGHIVKPKGNIPNTSFDKWFESFIMRPIETMEILGLIATPQSIP